MCRACVEGERSGDQAVVRFGDGWPGRAREKLPQARQLRLQEQRGTAASRQPVTARQRASITFETFVIALSPCQIHPPVDETR